MKALDPPSGRFDKNLRNTRFELNINAKEVKSNHFVQVPIPGVTLLDVSLDNNSSTASPGSRTFDGSYLDSPVKAPSVVDTPKGLYAYGDATISADNLVPKATPSWIAAPSPKAGGKSPTRRNEHLRAPVVNRGTLPNPVQQPPPPQPMGAIPASLLTPQNSMLFAAKSTSSLLGIQASMSRSFSELSRTVAVSASEPALQVYIKPTQRTKLSSVNLLDEYGHEVDIEHRENIAVQEPILERPSAMSSTPHGPPPAVAGGGFHFDAPRATSAGFDSGALLGTVPQVSSSRPTSPAVQLFDFNSMSQKEPPAPSTLEKHQQGLSLQMKMAYLHATTSGSNEEMSRKSRPNSRAQSSHARNIPLPVATQVFRVPSAGIQDKSFFSNSENDFNPTESIDSLKKIPQLEEGSLALTGTKSNLHMDSEMEMTLETPSKPSVEGIPAGKGSKVIKPSKQKLKQASLRASLSTTNAVAPANANPTPAKSKVPGFAGGDALTNSEAPAPLSPQLHVLLPPQQLDALQQPHYQDPRFQKNPREVIYKFHGHLLNTTPFPEEIAHLTLHGKSSRLPQYLKAQQEEQQVRYNNKVRVLASMQGGHKPSERVELAPLQNKPARSNNPTQNAPQNQILPAAGLNDLDFTDFAVVDTTGGSILEQDGFSDVDGVMESMPTAGLFMQDSLSLTSAQSALKSGKNAHSAKIIEQETETASVHSAAGSFAGSKDGSKEGSHKEGAGGSTRSFSGRMDPQLGDRATSPENGRTSPSRPRSRSLSIRLTAGQGMVEEHHITTSSEGLEGTDSMVAVMSDSAPPSAPPSAPHATASSALITLASSSNSNKIAAGFARAAVPSNHPISSSGFEDTLPNTFREDMVITGEPTGPKKLKIKTKVSPKRVAYVLNRHPAPGGEHEDHEGLDDQSLHSVHSLQNSVHSMATGNYSAITDDGNFSILKSPPAARKPRGFVSADNSHTGVESKYRPRLDSVAASSLASEASEAAIPMPFQVHRKVMGWKLTSTLQRRRNLVGMLDLVQDQRSTQDMRLAQSDGATKRTLNQLAAPRQVPHALLRTGHGKRSGHRDVPPLNKVYAHMVEINKAQQELQYTQVMQGFGKSTQMLQDKNFGTTPTLNLSRSITARSSRTVTPKKHALRASTSQLGNLAIQVETMARVLPSETPFDSP